MNNRMRRPILLGLGMIVFAGAVYGQDDRAVRKPIRGIRFMTEKFTVSSLPDNPLKRVPPQAGFVTALPPQTTVKILDPEGHWVGSLTPVTQGKFFNKTGEPTCDPNAETCKACIIVESYPSPNGTKVQSTNSGVPLERGAAARVNVPAPGLESFICQVAFHVDMFGKEQDLVVSGPRIVNIGETHVAKDGRLTTPVEIVEMYLSGFDAKGRLVTVRGGRNFGLPAISGEMRSFTGKSYFPASLKFDLELEVINWGMATGRSGGILN